MNSSEYTYLQKKKWRAITYNWDTLSTYGNRSNLYCLTDFQVAWLLSNTEYMRWGSRWVDCPCSQSDLDAMKAEMEYNLMSCIDIQPWQLDYVYEQTQNAQRDRYQDLYDLGGIPELNADTPTDFYSGDGSDERIDALCMACDTYVNSFVANWLEIARRANTALNFSILVVRFVPYIGTVAAIALKALSVVTQVAIDAMADEDAVNEVICCMYTTLDGSAVNQANFETCLDACGFAPGSNVSIVRDLVSADIDNFKNWLTFLNALGDSYVWMQAGVDYRCPCNVWDYEIDLTSILILPSWISLLNCQFDQGIGIIPLDADGTHNYMALDITADATTYEDLTLEFDKINGDFTFPSEDYIEFVGATVPQRYVGTPSISSTSPLSAAGVSNEQLSQRFVIACANAVGGNRGSMRMKKIILSGVGTKPSQFT